MEKRQCPTCSNEFWVAPKLSRSRPKTYCSVACRREAERKRRLERQAKRHAEYVASLPLSMQEFWVEVDANTRKLEEMIEPFDDLGQIFDLKKSGETLDRLAAGNAALEEILRGKG